MIGVPKRLGPGEEWWQRPLSLFAFKMHQGNQLGTISESGLSTSALAQSICAFAYCSKHAKVFKPYNFLKKPFFAFAHNSFRLISPRPRMLR